jgi:hypothetical protein
VDWGNGQKPIKSEMDIFQKYPFIGSKMKNGKLNCDRCGSEFFDINEFFIVVLESDKQIICYPCDYIRTGINPVPKRDDNEKIADVRIKRKKKEKEPPKMAKTEFVAEEKPKDNNAEQLELF